MSPVHRILLHLDAFGRRKQFLTLGAITLFLNWFVYVVWHPPGKLLATSALVDGTLLMIFGGLLGRHVRLMFATPHANVVPGLKASVLRTALGMGALASTIVAMLGPAPEIGWTILRFALGLAAGWSSRAWAAMVVLAVAAAGPLSTWAWLRRVPRADTIVMGLLAGVLGVTVMVLLGRRMLAPTPELAPRRRPRGPRIGLRWLGVGISPALDRLRRARSPRAPWSDAVVLAGIGLAAIAIPLSQNRGPIVGTLPLLLLVPPLQFSRMDWPAQRRGVELLRPLSRSRLVRLVGIGLALDAAEAYLVAAAFAVVPTLLFGGSASDLLRLQALALGANLLGLGFAALAARTRDWPYSSTVQVLLPAGVAWICWRAQWPWPAVVLGGFFLGIGFAALAHRVWRGAQFA